MYIKSNATCVRRSYGNIITRLFFLFDNDWHNAITQVIVHNYAMQIHINIKPNVLIRHYVLQLLKA